MDQLKSLGPALARLGRPKLALLGGTAAAALLTIALIAGQGAKPDGLLYSGLDAAEAGRIVARLEELRIANATQGEGAILVPRDQVARLRMQLASEGLPRQGGAGYELLDQANPMNLTSFMQRVQRLRALEGDIARTIVTMQGVRSARVHIVLPERESFSRDAPQPTASVTVTTNGAARLSPGQAQAIRLLVAGAVPRLRQEDVSVMDPSGVILAADGAAALAAGRVSEIRAGHEAQLQKAVLDLLEPIIGRGRVRAIASVDVDPARVVSREQRFDPMTQVERSRQTTSERETSEDSRGAEPTSVGQSLPNQRAGAQGAKMQTSRQSNGETVNFEISETVQETTREPGGIRRVTVAVVVDAGRSATGETQTRSREDLDRLSSLVKSAVGHDGRRGDVVTVESLAFTSADAPAGTLSTTETDSGNSMLAMLLGCVAAVGIGGLVAFILARRRRRAAEEARKVAEIAARARSEEAPDEQKDPLIKLERIEQQIRASSINGLNDLIDRQPEQTVSLLKAWIREGTTA